MPLVLSIAVTRALVANFAFGLRFGASHGIEGFDTSLQRGCTVRC